MFAERISINTGMTSPTMYYYTKVMSELFLDAQFTDTKNTYRGMTTMMDFWRVGHRTESDTNARQVSVRFASAEILIEK